VEVAVAEVVGDDEEDAVCDGHDGVALASTRTMKNPRRKYAATREADSAAFTAAFTARKKS